MDFIIRANGGSTYTGVAEVAFHATAWEFKAVSFGGDEKENTKRLNELAADGWQYVGPLGDGMVAFKRRALPAKQVAEKKE